MKTLTTDFPIKLVQITDSHLYAAPAGELLKMNTQNSLDHVVNSVKQNEGLIDLILATGDIAQDASRIAYENFIQSIGHLETPFRWIPGNHDNFDVMQEVAPGQDAAEKLLTINNWLIVGLDTTIAGHVHGNLSREEIQFLESSLEAAESDAAIDHCMLYLHHNPLKASSEWMEDIGLRNSEDFFAVLKRFGKTRCVIYGHIHQELDIDHQGVRCLCSPSTCIQFKPDVSNFELDALNPGYRSIKLFEDGSMETEVVRVSDQQYTVDYDSVGY